MTAKCKISKTPIFWPCDAGWCPLFGDCLSEYKIRLEAERDAAISDVPHDCEHCNHAVEDGACKLLPDGDQFSPDYTDGFDRDGNCDHWEWRGAQGEEQE